jgi:hypothetical protein
MRSRALLESPIQSFIDLLEYVLCIVLDFLAGETNDFDPLSIEPFGSHTIFLDSFGREVRQSIAFDAQFGIGAIEIEKVDSFDVLATELGVASLSVANE